MKSAWPRPWALEWAEIKCKCDIRMPIYDFQFNGNSSSRQICHRLRDDHIFRNFEYLPFREKVKVIRIVADLILDGNWMTDKLMKTGSSISTAFMMFINELYTSTFIFCFPMFKDRRIFWVFYIKKSYLHWKHRMVIKSSEFLSSKAQNGYQKHRMVIKTKKNAIARLSRTFYVRSGFDRNRTKEIHYSCLHCYKLCYFLLTSNHQPTHFATPIRGLSTCTANKH